MWQNYYAKWPRNADIFLNRGAITVYSVLSGINTLLQTESLDEAYLFYLHCLQENTPALNIVDDNNIAFTDEQYAALDAEWASLSPEKMEARKNRVKEIRELRDK